LTETSYEFTRAITRAPCENIISGLRAVDTGAPDLDLMRAHHADYVATLKSTGATVIELPSLEDYPDSVFVEDTALCLPKGAVLMRPGAPSRLGEVAQMAPYLREQYDQVLEITKGYIEGGDILTTSKEILVGLSARTDFAGVENLKSLVANWGYSVRIVNTPEGVLHFKTDCSLLDANTILSTPRLAASGCFDGYRVLHTRKGEEACANSIRFNQFVVMPAGFPKTSEMLRGQGYEVREIGNSECAKLDGGMSCLSLRF
jgi:dimethylargininase